MCGAESGWRPGKKGEREIEGELVAPSWRANGSGGNDQLVIAELKIYWGRWRRTLARIAQTLADRTRIFARILIAIESRGKVRVFGARLSVWRVARKLLSIFAISENFLTRWQKYRGYPGTNITSTLDASAGNFLYRKNRIELR